MTAPGPDVDARASIAPLREPADLPANRTPTLPLAPQRNSCPYRPVGGEAFRFAAEGSAFGFASHEMSLLSPDRNLKTAATDFKEASKGPAGPEHERSECEVN
jgi:hypothetical protein